MLENFPYLEVVVFWKDMQTQYDFNVQILSSKLRSKLLPFFFDFHDFNKVDISPSHHDFLFFVDGS